MSLNQIPSRCVSRLYDSKQDDFNLLLGKDTQLVHHHFGIGDFERRPGAFFDEESVQRRLHELENAQTERLLDLLDGFEPGQRIFDGGSGRGGTAFMAHSRFGCLVEGATISRYQLEFAEQQARSRGYRDKVRFHFMNMLRTGLAAASFDAVLALSHSQLCTVLDLSILHRIADCEHARLVNPIDDVNELLAEEIENLDCSDACGGWPRRSGHPKVMKCKDLATSRAALTLRN